MYGFIGGVLITPIPSSKEELDRVIKEWDGTFKENPKTSKPGHITVRGRKDGRIDELPKLKQWLDESCGVYDCNTEEGYTVAFEAEEDAVAFKLRWM